MTEDTSDFLLDDSQWPEPKPGKSAPLSRPSSLKAERALIGAAMLWPDLFESVRQIQSTDFSHPLRGDIWDSIRWLRAKSRAVDPVLLAHKLEGYGLAVPKPHAHWHAALGALLDDATSIAGDADLMRAYAAVVLEEAAERRRSGQKRKERDVA